MLIGHPLIVQWSAILQAVYSPALVCVKFAILLLYLRVFPQNSRKLRIYTYVIMAFVFAYSFAGFWVQIFACIPQAKIWDVTIQRGHCGMYGLLSFSFMTLSRLITPLPTDSGISSRHLGINAKTLQSPSLSTTGFSVRLSQVEVWLTKCMVLDRARPLLCVGLQRSESHLASSLTT